MTTNKPENQDKKFGPDFNHNKNMTLLQIRNSTAFKPQSVKPMPGLLVARDLDYIIEDYDIVFWGADPVIHIKHFRRLDAVYYLWLYTMIARARQSVARSENKLSVAQFEKLINRFAIIHSEALRLFGKGKVKAALLQKNALRGYEPPLLYPDENGPAVYDNAKSVAQALPEYSSKGAHAPRCPLIIKDDYGFTVFIEKAARVIVEQIEGGALKLGWEKESLWRNHSKTRFPAGNYGLACYIKPADEIIDVSASRIVIRRDHFQNGRSVRTSESRFYNPQDECTQHWRKLVNAQKI